MLGITELSDPHDLMYVYLGPGVRRVPTAADIVAAGLPVVQNADVVAQAGAGDLPLAVGPQRTAAALELVLSTNEKAPIPLVADTATSLSTALSNPPPAAARIRLVDHLFAEEVGPFDNGLSSDVANAIHA